MMNISQTGVDITDRFFTAIAVLSDLKYFRGVKGFCDDNKLNRTILVVLKGNPQNHILKPELINLLCEKYGISAEWLIRGEGEIFRIKKRIKR